MLHENMQSEIRKIIMTQVGILLFCSTKYNR
jgi:hypothetical protein